VRRCCSTNDHQLSRQIQAMPLSNAESNFPQVPPIFGLISSGHQTLPEKFMDSAHPIGLEAALHHGGMAADCGQKLALYGWLVGNWQTEVVTHDMEGKSHRGRGEIRAGWILEGKAIQDVWMIPPYRERDAGISVLPVSGNWYGTTIRAFDPKIDAWRIYWIDPATNYFRQQIGRQVGDDIVQLGEIESDGQSRWSFTKITPDSFHWLAEASFDKGSSWRLFVEVLARRAS
jgi:hypothetical protein